MYVLERATLNGLAGQVVVFKLPVAHPGMEQIENNRIGKNGYAVFPR